MRLAASTRLGPYEIVAPLGSGGMGEVYRARDTRLGREVAIKVLPQHLIANPEVHARFEREARTISSLNHPHICTLHDVGRAPGEAGSGDIEYLVMELVEGETLAQRLTKGAIPNTELLRLAVQIADALDRAHRAGIVHRDFKPGNVMITKSGAKLMDFGLARATATAAAAGASGSAVTIDQLTQSPTIASPLTAQGTLVGTFLYMSPEQLEGREADARSDLWAFGCVLYEMATGRRAFEGKSQASLIGAIMHSEPAPISASGSMASPALEALVRACLVKDPDERIQTAHDVKLQLSWISQSGSQSGMAVPALPPRKRSREPIAWGVAAVSLLTAAFFAWRGMGNASGNAQQIRFTIPIPPSVVTADLPRVSPDGRMLAFSAQDSANRSMIWLRPLNSLTANPIPGTENSSRPHWSPDSRYLGFVADGKLKKVAVSGGPPEVICDAPNGFDGSWSRKGVILFDGRAEVDGIRRVNAAGGVATPAMPPDSSAAVGWPAFLPDSKHYFYTLLGRQGSQIMLGTLGAARGKPLGVAGSRVEYSPDGHILFARDRTLLAQRFNPWRLKIEGEPFPVAENLPVGGNAQANFSVSSNGVLVYRATGAIASRLVWLDRNGHELEQVAPAADYRSPALSPDGRRIALRRRDSEGANLDVWVMEPARGTTTRFTFAPEGDGNPIWSRDGAQIAWGSDRPGKVGIWLKAANGTGEDQFLAETAPGAVPLDWSPDGRHILYMSGDNRGTDLWIASTTPGQKPEALLKTEFNENRAHFSPDGRWIAYESDESGRFEVYAMSFNGPAGKWQISTRGGREPCWSPDGREIYYLADDSRLMSVPVESAATFNPGTPAALFPVRAETGRRRNVYCPSPDGKRFLFLVLVGESNTPMTAVINWRTGSGRK